MQTLIQIGGIGKVTEHILRDALGINTCEEILQKSSYICALFSHSTAGCHFIILIFLLLLLLYINSSTHLYSLSLIDHLHIMFSTSFLPISSRLHLRKHQSSPFSYHRIVAHCLSIHCRFFPLCGTCHWEDRYSWSQIEEEYK